MTMNNSQRRDFLRKTAGSVGAATALTMLPPSIRRALAVEAHVETGTIKDVQHVVILMQENRAFDHYFGTMKGVRGFGDRFPIPLESGKPVWFQSDGNREIPPYHRDSATSNALLAPGTPHSFSDSQAAWNQGKMGYWPKYKNQYSMGHYRRADIPFQFALAEAFTICDDYHCSITTGTDPNRIVFWSGSNFNPELGRQGINCQDDQSEPNNDRCWIKGTWVPGAWPSGYQYADNAFTWDTIPDVLQRAGVTWRIFQDMNNNWTGAMNGCNAFASFRNAMPGTPIYENGMTNWSIADLKQQVMTDTLPQVCWILPTQQNSEHPGGPSSPTHGANFTSQVLDALTSNPAVWAKTAMFVTFDENDGFFDHVPAPAVPSYNADGTLAGKATLPLDGEYFYDPARKYLKPEDTISGTTRPWGMSARVPMYVVSPWSKGGWVNSQVFDHTSVGMFLEKRFGITMTTISPWHRAVSGDLTSAFDFARPNDPTFPKLPDVSGYAASDAAQKLLPAALPPATPAPLFQETGVRFSRALPYELHTSARVEGRGMLSLVFANSGMQGAVFHVYDKLHLDRIPRRYTVEAGKTLIDTWNTGLSDSGKYELWVYGPNGYVRSFKGNALFHDTAAFQPEVQIGYETHSGHLYLRVRNSGKQAGHVTVTSNAYFSDGPWTMKVKAGETETEHWNLKKSGDWYDFTVTSDNFERRFAGRVETGKPGVSDPAMALHLQA